MKKPEPSEIESMKRFLSLSIRDLIRNDKNIFNDRMRNPHEEGSWYRRKLHEITVCHRLAVYFERNLVDCFLGRYNVDLEYNKNHESLKGYQDENNNFKHVRPDIIIHSRTDATITKYQHLLIVEAKMGAIPVSDKKKVLKFMEMPEYSYLFGLTVSFWENKNLIKATLYYYDANWSIQQYDASEPIILEEA